MANEYLKKTAELNKEQNRRFTLVRQWADHPPNGVFIMLNPSTADAFEDDPTIRRCVNFGKALGWGGMTIVNLFSARTPHPAELWKHPTPYLPSDDDHILKVLSDPFGVPPVIVAWGNLPKKAYPRAKQVLQLLRRAGCVPTCLGTTDSGDPRHPLYLPTGSHRRPFRRTYHAQS